MISIGSAVVCTKEASDDKVNDSKEIWMSKGRFWNSFISEFKVISQIEDMAFLEKEVTNYDPCPDTLYAPWLPEWASPTFGCLQRLNYVWRTYCKRCVITRQTSQLLDHRRSQLEEYTYLVESMQKCLDLCVMPRSGVSMDYYPSFRYRCIISVFPWSIFLNKDFKAFLLALIQASIDFPPTVVVILFSNNRLWNGQLFWNKNDFILALTTFLTNACPTYISIHVSLTTNFLHIKNENLVKNDILMFSNILTYLPFWNVSPVDVHTLCSNFLVYFTGETLFYYDHTKECSEEGFSTVETLCLQFRKAKEFEIIKSLLNLKFFCYEYSMYAEKLNATQKHLNNGGIQCILQHISLCEYILLTLPQRVHYILSTLAPCYIHVNKIEKTKYLIELDTGLLVNVLSHLFNYHSKLLNSRAACNTDYYIETFQTTVWEPLALLRNFSDTMLLSQFCYPPWLETTLNKESKSTSDLTPHSLKEALETFKIPLYETFIYFYFKSLCCSPMSLSRQLLVNYQEILCLQNATITFSIPISQYISKNIDPVYCYYEEADAALSSLLFEKQSSDPLPASSELESNFIQLRKFFFLIGVKILTFHDFFHSQVILGKFFLLLADICNENVDYMKSLFFVKTFKPFVNSFTSTRCYDINVVQPSAHSSLMYIWTCILVGLVHQQRILNSLDALLDCRLKDHITDLFTVTDFVDNTPQANYKILFKVMLCVNNSTQDISLIKFYKNWDRIFPRLTVDKICEATIVLLCDVKELTVAPQIHQCLSELRSIFQSSGTLNKFYHILHETVYTIAYSTLSTVNQFSLQTSIFCKNVLSLQDPCSMTALNKDLTRRIEALHHILSISDTCLSLVESLPIAPSVRHFSYNLPTTFSNRENQSSTGRSIRRGLPFLYPPWVEQHICHPLLFIRQLLYYFPKLASDEYWDSVEKLYNQLQGKNKLENSVVTIKLCQVISLMDQGKIMQALVSFSKLSSALKFQTDPTVRTLKSIWAEHHCIQNQFTCFFFSSSSLRYFSIQMVEEVRFYLGKLSLDLCSVLLETQTFHTLNDSLLKKIIKQVGILFSESHFIQNHPTRISEKPTEVFNENDFKAYSLLQSIKNLWEYNQKKKSSFEAQIDQGSNVYNDLLLYDIFYSSNITKKDLLMQPAVKAAKKTLQVLSSAATSMFLLPVANSSNIFSHNHDFEPSSKDSEENDNTSRPSAIDVFVENMNYSSLSTPLNENNSKTSSCLQISNHNSVYDHTNLIPQERLSDADHSMIIKDMSKKQETISENLTGFLNAEAVLNTCSDTDKLKGSPLSSGFTPLDRGKSAVKQNFQKVTTISHGQTDSSRIFQKKSQTNTFNHLARQTKQEKISCHKKNSPTNFRFSYMNFHKIRKPSEKYSFSLPDVTAIRTNSSLEALKTGSLSSTESQVDLIKDNVVTYPTTFLKEFCNSTLVPHSRIILLSKNRKKHSTSKNFENLYCEITSYSDTVINSRKRPKYAINRRSSLSHLTNRLCNRMHDTPDFSSSTSEIRIHFKQSDRLSKKKTKSLNEITSKNIVLNHRKSNSRVNKRLTKHYAKSFLDENRNQAMKQQFNNEVFVKNIGDVSLSRNIGKKSTAIKCKLLSDVANDQAKRYETPQTNGNIQGSYTEETVKDVQSVCNFPCEKKKKEMVSSQLSNIDCFKSNASIEKTEKVSGSTTDKKCTENDKLEEHFPTNPNNYHCSYFEESNKTTQNTMPNVTFDHVREHVENRLCKKTTDVSDLELSLRQLSIPTVPEFDKCSNEKNKNQIPLPSFTLNKKNTPLYQEVNQHESTSVNEVDALKEIVNSLKREACSENKVASSLVISPGDKKNVTKSLDKTEDLLKNLFTEEFPDKPIPSHFLQSLTSASKWIFSIPFYEAQDKSSSLGNVNSNILNRPENKKRYETDEEKTLSHSSDFASNTPIKLLKHTQQTNQFKDTVSPISPLPTNDNLTATSGKIWGDDLSSISSLNTFSSSPKSRKTLNKQNKSLPREQNYINGSDSHNFFQDIHDLPKQQIKPEDTPSKKSFENNIDWDDEIPSLGDSENSMSSNVSNHLYSFIKKNSQSLKPINAKESLCSANSNTTENLRLNYTTKPMNSVVVKQTLNSSSIDSFHDNFIQPNDLDPLLSSNLYAEHHPRMKNEFDELKTYSSQLSFDFSKDTIISNDTDLINTERNSLLRRNSLSTFHSQNDPQNIKNVSHSRASKYCPHQIADLQTAIHTNFSAMQDHNSILPFLFNSSLKTTRNHIHWNADPKSILNNSDNIVSFSNSIIIPETLPPVDFNFVTSKKNSEHIETTNFYSRHLFKGKADIINYFNDGENSFPSSTPHAVFTREESNDLDVKNPLLKDSFSRILKAREINKNDSRKISLKNTSHDSLQHIKEPYSCSEILSCTDSCKKRFAANRDVTTSPFNSQKVSFEDKNEKKFHYCENNFSSSIRLNDLCFSKKDFCNKNKEMSSCQQNGHSFSQKRYLFNNARKHNITVYCKAIFFNDETKIPRIECIFLIKYLKWFYKTWKHTSTLCGQDISLLRLETYSFLYKLLCNQNYKLILLTSFRRLIGIKNKSGWSFVRFVIPGDYKKKYTLTKTNLRNTRKISVFSKVPTLTFNNKATLTVWRNSVSLSIAFNQFLSVKNQLPMSDTGESVLVKQEQALFNYIQYEFITKYFATPSYTNLLPYNKRKFNVHDKHTIPISKFKISDLNKLLRSKPGNIFLTRMKSMTFSGNCLKYLSRSSNTITSHKSASFSLNENNSGLGNNIAPLDSYSNLLISKKDKKEPVNNNVIPNYDLDMQMSTNPKVTVSKNGSTVSLQFTEEPSEKLKKYASIANTMISQTRTIRPTKPKVIGFDEFNRLPLRYTPTIAIRKKPDSCNEKKLLIDETESFSDTRNELNSWKQNDTSTNQLDILLLEEQDVTYGTIFDTSSTYSKDFPRKQEPIGSIHLDSLSANSFKICTTHDKKFTTSYNENGVVNDFKNTRQYENRNSELQNQLYRGQMIPETNHQPFLPPIYRNSTFSNSEKRRTITRHRSLSFSSYKTRIVPLQPSDLNNLKVYPESDTTSLRTNGRRSFSPPFIPSDPNQTTLENVNTNTGFYNQLSSSYSSITKVQDLNDENLLISRLRKHVPSLTKKNHNVKKTDSSPILKTSFHSHPMYSHQRNKGDSFDNLTESPALNHFLSNTKHNESFIKQNSLQYDTDHKIIDNWSDKTLLSCKTDDSDLINKNFTIITPYTRSPMKPQISSSNKNSPNRSNKCTTFLICKKSHAGNKFDLPRNNKDSISNGNDASLSDALVSQAYNEESVSSKRSFLFHQNHDIIQGWSDELVSSSESENLNSATEASSSMIVYDRSNENLKVSFSVQKTANLSYECVISPIEQKSPSNSKNNLSNIIQENCSVSQMGLSNSHEMSPQTYNLEGLHHEQSNLCKFNQKYIEAWRDELVLSEFSQDSVSITQDSPILNELNVAPVKQQLISLCEKSQNQPKGRCISPIKEQTSFFNVNESFDTRFKSFLKQQKQNNSSSDESESIHHSKEISDKQLLGFNSSSKKTQDTNNEIILPIHFNNFNSSTQQLSTNHPYTMASITSHKYPENKGNTKKFKKTTKLSVPHKFISDSSKIIAESNEKNSSANYPNTPKLNKTCLHTIDSDPVSRKCSSESHVAQGLVQDWSDDFLSSSFSESSELISSKLSEFNKHFVLPINTHVSSTSPKNRHRSSGNVPSFDSKQPFSSNTKDRVKCKENCFLINQSNSVIPTESVSYTHNSKDFLDKSPLTLEEDKEIMQNWSDDLSVSNHSEYTQSAKKKSRG